jgi:hypothetical protein
MRQDYVRALLQPTFDNGALAQVKSIDEDEDEDEKQDASIMSYRERCHQHTPTIQHRTRLCFSRPWKKELDLSVLLSFPPRSLQF